MGTRNLVMVKVNNKIKVAQYGQWDGYPTGQGKTIAEFLHSPNFDLCAIRKHVHQLRWATEEEIKNTWTECGADPKSDMVTLLVADNHTKRFPEFSRNTGAGILALVQTGKVKRVQDNRDFIKDSLFCEWAYLVNFDTQTVSVYRGFQATGQMETITLPTRTYTREKYGRCKLIKRYKFKDFTVEAMQELEEEVSKKENEGE